MWSVVSDGVPDLSLTTNQTTERRTGEADGREGRSHLESTPLSGVRGDIPVGAEGSDRSLRGTLGGTVRVDDPADEWFRDYARDNDMTLAQLQRESGILTRHQEAEIRKREVPIGSDGT